MIFDKNKFKLFIAILTLGFSLTIGVISFLQSIDLLNKPSPGFFFGPNSLVSIGQRKSWNGVNAGLKALDKIVAVNGHFIQSHRDVFSIVNESPVGTMVKYQVVRNHQIMNVNVPTGTYTLGDFIVVCLVPFLMGLLFISFGAVVYFKTPLARGRLVYLLICSLIGLFCITLFENHTTYRFFSISLMYPLIGSMAVHLFSMFVEKQRTRSNIAVILFYAVGFVLVIARLYFFNDQAHSQQLSKYSSIFSLSVILTSLYLMVFAYSETKNQDMKDKIKIMFIGLFIACSVIIAYAFRFLSESKFFYFDEGMILTCAFPLFMSYAIVRKNIFGLDRVIRGTLSYFFSSSLILIFYLGIISTVKSFLPPNKYGEQINVFMVILAAVLALIYNQTRNLVNDILNRFIFKNQHQVKEALLKLSNLLTSEKNFQQEFSEMGKQLVDVLHIEKASFFIASKSLPGHKQSFYFLWPKPVALSNAFSLFQSEGLFDLHRGDLNIIDVEDFVSNQPGHCAQSMAFLKANRIAILITLKTQDKRFGFILLGQKISKEQFDQNDFDVLRPLFEKMILILHNAELIENTSLNARMAALGNMSSVLIHDIKNPLTTIKISAGSIKKRFKEGDHCFELATFIEEEVDRMNQTITEVLTFANPASKVFETCSLNSICLETSQRLKTIFDEKNVKLDFLPSLEEKHIDANPIRLSRAIENLLMNALQASPKNSSVILGTKFDQQSEDTEQMIMFVKDQGGGIVPSIRENIFQPFFTTKPSGTGLGLSIVTQVVAEHNGKLDLNSIVNVGSEFVVTLPVHGA